MCWVWDTGCHAEKIADGFIGEIQKSVNDAMAGIMSGLNTFWMKVPGPDLGSFNQETNTYEPSSIITFLQTNLAWVTAVVMIISVLFAGGQMVWQRSGQPLQELVAAWLKLMVVSGCGLGATVVLLQAGDSFSSWIIDQSLGEGQDFGAAMTSLMGSGEMGAMMTIVAGIIAIIVGIIQIGLLIVRAALSYLLGGTLALAFSATNTKWGKQWSEKQLAFLIVLILYKPVASIIYATSFKLTADSFKGEIGTGSAGEVIVTQLTGLILMFMSLLALPILMKFLVPMVGSVGGGGAGMFAAAGLGAAASGAINSGKKQKGGGGGDSRDSGSSSGEGQATGARSSSEGGAAPGTGAGTGGSGGKPGGSGGAAAEGAAGGAAAASGGAAVAVKKGAELAEAGKDAAQGAVASEAGAGDGARQTHEPSGSDKASSGSRQDAKQPTNANRGPSSGGGQAGSKPTGSGNTSKGSRQESRGGSGSRTNGRAKEAARQAQRAVEAVNEDIAQESEGPSGNR